MLSHSVRPSGFLLVLIAGAGSAGLLPGCGSRSDTEDYLFGAPAGGGPSPAGAGTSPGNGARNGGDDSEPGRPGGEPGSPGGPGSSGGRFGVGGAPSAGGAPGTAGAATGGIGTAGSPAGPTLGCGSALCDRATQICCASLGGFGCIEADAVCNGAVLSCTSSTDCGGRGVCCLGLAADGSAPSSCQASCSDQPRQRQLCRTDDECPRNRPLCLETVFGVSVCVRNGGNGNGN